MDTTHSRKRVMALWASMVLLAAALPGSAGAAVVGFQAVDLADARPGLDLWEYRYRVSGHEFKTNVGFTIFFDYRLYGSLDPEKKLTAPDNDWDVLAIDPDVNLPDDGYYDALALRDGAPLDKPFIVSFVWLGTGTPGAQPFEIYDSSGSIVLAGKSTQPVPIPATALLLAGGIAGVCGTARKGRRES